MLQNLEPLRKEVVDIPKEDSIFFIKLSLIWRKVRFNVFLVLPKQHD